MLNSTDEWSEDSKDDTDFFSEKEVTGEKIDVSCNCEYSVITDMCSLSDGAAIEDDLGSSCSNDSLEKCGSLSKLDKLSPTDMTLAHNRKSRQKCHVSFSQVEIRKYGLTLGDNPCCSYGPPVSLSWVCYSEDKIDLDSYELNRGPRRTLRELFMNYYERKNILRFDAGYSETEIKLAIKRVNKVKTQRSISKAVTLVEPLVIVAESAARKIKRIINKQK